jgi:hypothetical protein
MTNANYKFELASTMMLRFSVVQDGTYVDFSLELIDIGIRFTKENRGYKKRNALGYYVNANMDGMSFATLMATCH